MRGGGATVAADAESAIRINDGRLECVGGAAGRGSSGEKWVNFCVGFITVGREKRGCGAWVFH